jgi:hypothetical protein
VRSSSRRSARTTPAAVRPLGAHRPRSSARRNEWEIPARRAAWRRVSLASCRAMHSRAASPGHGVPGAFVWRGHLRRTIAASVVYMGSSPRARIFGCPARGRR